MISTEDKQLEVFDAGYKRVEFDLNINGGLTTIKLRAPMARDESAIAKMKPGQNEELLARLIEKWGDRDSISAEELKSPELDDAFAIAMEIYQSAFADISPPTLTDSAPTSLEFNQVRYSTEGDKLTLFDLPILSPEGEILETIDVGLRGFSRSQDRVFMESTLNAPDFLERMISRLIIQWGDVDSVSSKALKDPQYDFLVDACGIAIATFFRPRVSVVKRKRRGMA